MNRLDDLLDRAADDLHHAVDRMFTEAPLDARGPTGTEMAFPHADLPRGGARRVLAIASGVVAVVVVGALVVASGPSHRNTPIGASTTASPTPASSSFRPLELPDTPRGYAAVPRVIRPAARDGVKSAVVIKRNGAGAVIDRVIMRAGDLGRYGNPPLRRIFAPTNLPTASDGTVSVNATNGTVRIEFSIGSASSLILEAHHPDPLTREQLATEMEQIVPVLSLAPSNDLSIDGTLPAGWELAVAGNEPETVVPTYLQAFEVDRPDGGAKIIVSNLPINDPGVPYWEMLDTLTTIEVRGHAGHLSLDSHAYVGPTPVPTLIWQEAAGHWVTLRADGMTTEQLLDVADRLTPVSGDWVPQGGDATTTTALASPG